MCERDEGFKIDMHVKADIEEFMRIWMGRSTWRDAISSGKITLDGPRDLTRQFTDWFALSPFATRELTGTLRTE